MERCLIEKNTIEVEYGVRLMLDRYWWLREKLNTTNANTDYEVMERVKLIEERNLLQKYLKMLNIQDFEIKDEWLVFKII